ncbi:hypothetical protein V8017_19725 [Stenotrophomonas rhizophila]
MAALAPSGPAQKPSAEIAAALGPVEILAGVEAQAHQAGLHPAAIDELLRGIGEAIVLGQANVLRGDDALGLKCGEHRCDSRVGGAPVGGPHFLRRPGFARHRNGKAGHRRQQHLYLRHHRVDDDMVAAAVAHRRVRTGVEQHLHRRAIQREFSGQVQRSPPAAIEMFQRASCIDEQTQYLQMLGRRGVIGCARRTFQRSKAMGVFCADIGASRKASLHGRHIGRQGGRAQIDGGRRSRFSRHGNSNRLFHCPS